MTISIFNNKHFDKVQIKNVSWKHFVNKKACCFVPNKKLTHIPTDRSRNGYLREYYRLLVGKCYNKRVQENDVVLSLFKAI